MSLNGYRVRLRLHTSNYLTDDASEPSFSIGARTLGVQSPQHAEKLKSTRVILNARGLPDEGTAVAFGNRLRSAVSVAAALRQFGVDMGENRATSMLARWVKDRIQAGQNITIRDDVHGLDIFHDDGTIRHFGMSAEATVSTPAQVFLGQVGIAFEWVVGLPENLIEAAQLLNAADYSGAPLVKLALSCSAIETMAPDLQWTDEARALVDDLIQIVKANASVAKMERDQIAQALATSRYRSIDRHQGQGAAQESWIDRALERAVKGL